MNQSDFEKNDLFETEQKNKAIRKTFNRCGFAAFGLIAFTATVSFVLGFLLPEADESVLSFYRQYLLVFNEIIIAVAVAIGALLLIGVSKCAPERAPQNPKLFFLLLLICIPVATIGNTAGTIITTVWSLFTGNEVTNGVVEILTQTSPIQTLICAGIIAPILEELFFRKLLIDRMRKHGEFAAIFISALLFGLFHQNFSQFFYTFGLGLILAYLYCRTGSYLTVTLFHMIFNIVMGVIPSFFVTGIFEMLTKISELSEEMLMSALPGLLSEYALSIIFYLLHSTAISVFNVIGIIFFILNIKKIRLESDGSGLGAGAHLKAAVCNPGMICSFVLLCILTVSSLFA
jgi:membrane protease YdiL (CAAX protease family)